MKTISLTGMAFCLIYLVATAVCVGMALTADPKGEFVFLQVPLALQLAALSAIGLDPFLRSLSWISAYILLGGLTLCGLYAGGASISRLYRCTRRPDNHSRSDRAE